MAGAPTSPCWGVRRPWILGFPHFWVRGSLKYPCVTFRPPWRASRGPKQSPLFPPPHGAAAGPSLARFGFVTPRPLMWSVGRSNSAAVRPVAQPAGPTAAPAPPPPPWSTARATALSPGRPTPGVVKQDKSSGGSVDTTKTRSGPRRVRMSKGREANRRRQRQTIRYRGLVPTPPPPAAHPPLP